MQFATTQLLPSRSGNVGILQLNNPKALNALTLPMVRALNEVLPTWRKDTSLKALLMIGTAEPRKNKPTFCAGGDVKSVYESGLTDRTPSEHGWGYRITQSSSSSSSSLGKEGGLLTADFFREEYQMNYRIATQPSKACPQISLWDGIVMGGGVGASVHGKYRVATEKTVFAMPETGIGFFPDVGGMFWIPRLGRKNYNNNTNNNKGGGGGGGIGTYLALTGARLKADDLLYTGIATHYIRSERLNELRLALVNATENTTTKEEKDANANSSTGICGDDLVAPVLLSFHEDIDTTNSFLAKNRNEIDKAFADKGAVEDIIIALQSLESEFGKKTLQSLSKMSPTSLKVTLEGIKRGGALSNIKDVLTMEYRMSQGFMREGSDFYEGIRALLVDKDNNPQWNPQRLEDVTDDMVQTYFDSLGENDLSLIDDDDDDVDVGDAKSKL